MSREWPAYAFPEWRWDMKNDVAIRDSGGPTRVVTDEPDPNFKPRPVGFGCVRLECFRDVTCTAHKHSMSFRSRRNDYYQFRCIHCGHVVRIEATKFWGRAIA